MTTAVSLRQVVYLSARPELLAETHAHVQHFLPWLTSVVVVAPARVAAQVQLPGATVLTDEELVGALDTDHTTRNFRLRAALCRSGATDSVFLSSDDDYRPLKALGPERFVHDDGRLASYRFYDLRDWTADTTPFDQGQQNSLALLSYLGAPLDAYASHMPQAVDAELFASCAAEAVRLAPDAPLDEWAVFGNLGRQLAPERFAPPEPLLTLAWPEYPNQWRRAVVPSEHAFENFYPQLYEPGHLFAGLPTAVDPARVEQDAVEKIRRWRRLDLAIRRLEVPDDVVSPWTPGSALRRAYLRALKPALKTRDLLLLGERAGER